MALRATIYKAQLHIADNDKGYYGTHQLTVARHPSETDERLMIRLLVYALHVDAEESLAFTRGLSETEEPDLWRRDLTGLITLWLETGLPDERRLLKACGRATDVVVYAYGRNADLWWNGIRRRTARADNLRVYRLPSEQTQTLATLAQRNMELNINVQDGTVWFCGQAGEAVVDIIMLDR